jgi:hypothetical protein
MLWYGAKINKLESIIKLSKNKNNKLTRKRCWDSTRPVQMNKQTFYFYKPAGWDAAVVSSKHMPTRVIFFYSQTYYFKISLPQTPHSLTFNPNTSSFVMHTLYINNNYRLFLSHFNLVFTSFYKPFFRKVKFKGKGYYIYKNKRNTITPQFGYSHRLYLYSYFTSVKFLSKTSVFIFGLLKSDVITTSIGIKAMRPINIFTGRGVRFSREVIYKKVGKVSSYR